MVVAVRRADPVSWELLMSADAAGIRLEYAAGLPVWEAWPSPGHQERVDAVRASIRRPIVPAGGGACECRHYSDIYIQFPDGSLLRPDISIFCQRPIERDRAVTMMPEAVVEILSQETEAKDIEVLLPFYVAIGVKDVIVVAWTDNRVLHVTRDGRRDLTAPVTIDLQCGCQVGIPEADVPETQNPVADA